MGDMRALIPERSVWPVITLLVVIALVACGLWPITSAKTDYNGVEELASGTTSRLQSVSWNPCTSEALMVGVGGTILRYSNTSIIQVQSGTTMELKSVAWSPDCTQALIVGGSGLVLRYKNGNVTSLSSGTTSLLQDVAWTKDGKAVIAAGTTGILWYDGTHFTMQALPVAGIEIFGLAWKPDGDFGIAVGQKLSVFKFSSTGIEQIESPLGPAADISFYKASWRPDGSEVTIVGQKGTVVEWNELTYTAMTSGGGGAVITFLDVDWRSDGDFALICGDTGTLIAYRGENDWPYTPTKEVLGLLYGLEWSADGKTALIVGNNGAVLRYPGKTKAGEATYNPAILVLIVVIVIAFMIGVVLIYRQDREVRDDEDRTHRHKRSIRHGKRHRRRH